MRALPPGPGPARGCRRCSRRASRAASRAAVHRGTRGDPRATADWMTNRSTQWRLRRLLVVADITPVRDPADPRVDDFRDLTMADRRPDRPGGRGLVIAEGVVVVRRLIDSPYPVRSLLGVPRRFDELAGDLAALRVPAYAADAETMAAVVGFHLNRGVLAVADRAAAPGVDSLNVATAAAVAFHSLSPL